jgi:hypothetical protein
MFIYFILSFIAYRSISSIVVELSMKRFVILFALTILASYTFAQTPAPPSQPAAPSAPSDTTGKSFKDMLGGLAGEWEGEGVSRGEREFIGKLSAQFELDDEALLIKRESMNKQGTGPSGGLKELMLIGTDGTTKKIIMTVYANNNFIGLYVGEVKGTDVVFNSTTAASGYTDRRTFRKLPDGSLSFFTEGGGNGKPVAKVVEINFKKKM